MAATETFAGTEKSESADAQAKTVFNILSKLKEIEPNERSINQTPEPSEENDDIVILRRDPNTKRKTINKTAYLKLHRSLSPNKNNTIDKIKEQYEKNDRKSQDSSEIDSSKKQETLETIKSKYSPAGLGYTKPQPAPRPRRSKLARSAIILPSKKDPIKNARFSLNIEKNKNKDLNSNDLLNTNDNISSDEEFISIVTRSDSEESIYKFQKELSAFTMDKKKRANSFRKIFSVFSNKDKKKKQEDKNKSQNQENGETYSDNFNNESNNFNKQTPYRPTTETDSQPLKSFGTAKVQKGDSAGKVPTHYSDPQLERDYAQMHINQFNKFKQNFDIPSNQNINPGNIVPHDGYTIMDKPIHKNQISDTTYMNMPTVRKYIDTSSSASTLESDRSNLYQNEGLSRPNQNNQSREDVELRHYPSNSFRPSRVTDGRRDTPPRLLETQQDVRLVNPKALIPINSERPLPNPYQNGNIEPPVENLMARSYPLSQSNPANQGKNIDVISRRPNLEETYGTVLDSLENRQRSIRAQSKNSLSPKDYEKPPRSPSLEASKLKLPPNRDIIPLSPRVKSPIPSDNISTEKIIATELLKPKRSPTPTKKGTKDGSPSHQRLEIDIDYPDNVKYASKNSLLRSADNLVYKPPIVAKPAKKLPENPRITIDNHRISQASPNRVDNLTLRQNISQASPIDSIDPFMTNVQVHMNSPINRTPTPNNSVQNLSLSPTRPTNISIRPLTPSGSRILESPKTTPQKEDIRKSVEAYYWKEIKKLKDQENQELYLLQMQYGNMFPYGYAEDPRNVRRARSMSPSAAKHGRRSLSLPRDTRPPPNVIPEKYYPNAIPENRAVTNQIQPRSVQQLQFQQQQYFNRNAPERRTIDGSNPRNYENNTNSLYRPIFKRGSLNTPPSQVADDSLKRKVSFSGAEDLAIQSWPTRNGFTQSPPQRRIDKPQSQGDDEVFFPNTPKFVNDNIYRYSESNTRPDLPNEEIYYNTRQNIIGPNGEPMYVARTNQNTLYLQQKQAAKDPYGQRINQTQRYLPNQSEEVLYGQPIDAVRPAAPVQGLTRHGSIQINEEMYGQRPSPKRIPYQNNSLIRPNVSSTPVPNQDTQYIARQSSSQQNVQPLRREIILNDEIFGQFGGYVGPNNTVRPAQNQNVYASRQSIAEYNSRVRDEYYNRSPQRQVSITNRVCDIYGQIHDSDPPKVQQSGMIMGQLHRGPGSPPVVRTSQAQLSGRDNFVRNSRLTASANDMYRRVQNINPQYPNDIMYGKIEPTQVQNGNIAPNRPLPPVPQGKKEITKGVVRNNLVSDTESGSDASEVQRILNSKSKTKKRGIFEEEWNSDGKSGRGSDGARSDNEGGEVRGRSRSARRDDPRRHTLGAGADGPYLVNMTGQGGPLSRTMDLEGHLRGYPGNAMLFDDDPGIMSEVETSSTGFRRGGKQRSSLPVVRTPSKTLERPLGLVFLQYRTETKRALLPNEITSIDTVKALFVRSFPKQLTMEYLDSPNVKIYIHDSSKDMFYELEDLRSHLREIRDRSVLRLIESADVSGGLPMAGIGIAGGVGHFEDPSYFSEPEFDSEYQHQHIHKSKVGGKSAPYYMGSTTSLPRGATFLRTYSPAVSNVPAERLKPLPTGAPPKPQRAYSSGASRNLTEGPPRPPDRFAPFQRPANPLYVPGVSRPPQI